MLNSLCRLPPARTSCRCISCLSTTAARRPRPFHLQFTHLTTLFYASIITTAATADIQAKQRRRAKWDAAIAEAERSIHTTSGSEGIGEEGQKEHREIEQLRAWEVEAIPETRENAISRSLDNEDLVNEAVSSDSDASFSMPRLQEDRQVEVLGSLGREQRYSRRPIIKDNHRGPRNSIYASIWRRNKYKKPWTMKKLATVELSIAKMTTRFAMESYSDDPSERNIFSFLDFAGQLDASVRRGLQRTLEEVEAKLRQIRTVNARDPLGVPEALRVQRPRYDPLSGSDEGPTEQLQEALLSIFSRLAHGGLSYQEALSRISYNLMVAAWAPDTQIYTILVHHFSILGHYNAAEIVIDSWTESHIRPNEMFTATVVTHYNRSGNKRAFERFVPLMRGDRGGLMLAKPTTPLDGVAASRLTRWRENKITQALTFDALIYSSVITTYLRFDQPEEAHYWRERMISDNIEVGLDLAVCFLRYDAQNRKQASLRAWWEYIQSRWLTENEVTELDHVDYDYARTAFHIMLYYCKENDMPKLWHDIYAEALSCGFSMREILMPISATHILEMDATNSIRRIRKILERRLETLLDDVKVYQVHTMATKAVLTGLPLKAIYALFERHFRNQREQWMKWKEDRPWLGYKSLKLVHSKQSPSGEKAAARNRIGEQDLISWNRMPVTRHAISKPKVQTAEAGGSFTDKSRSVHSPSKIDCRHSSEDRFSKHSFQQAPLVTGAA